jgi:hypothetical protein
MGLPPHQAGCSRGCCRTCDGLSVKWLGYSRPMVAAPSSVTEKNSKHEGRLVTFFTESANLKTRS